MSSLDIPREKSLEILSKSEDGAFADPLLEHARQSLDSRDRGFMLELVYGVLRHRSRLDWVLDQFSRQPIAKTDVQTRNILRLGAYQMLFLDKVPVSAAVNTSTELAKVHGKKSGYVNGLLRNLDRKRNSIAAVPPGHPAEKLAILYSHPSWLIRRWLARFGTETTETLLRQNNRASPLTIRTNTVKTSRDQLRASLESDGAKCTETEYSPQGIEIISSPGLRSLQAYQKGWFLVQDEAAQLVALMLGPSRGDRVLDACAAPGGKATHLAEMMGNEGIVVAVESDPDRTRKISENTARLGISIVAPVLGDAATFQEGLFDKILIDAPCSGLGVLRRHPDGRWNKKETTIRERAKAQKAILENCARLLKPNGALVYATCTTEPEENEHVIESFLAVSGSFKLDDARPYLPERARKLVDAKGFFHTFPDEPAMDGFFAARLVKKKQ